MTRRRRIHLGNPARTPRDEGEALCHTHRVSQFPLVIVPVSLPPHPAVDCLRCLAGINAMRGHA